MAHRSLPGLLAVLLLAACTPARRVGKFLVPEQLAIAARPEDQLATITVASGWEREAPTPYWPDQFVQDGVLYERPMPITEDGWVEVYPEVEGVRVRVATRHAQGDFQPVVVLTGAIAGRVPNELRPLPGDTPLTGPFRLTMRDLANVYNPTPLRDGDLVLLTVSDPLGNAEHYLLLEQDFGFRTHVGAGVLVRVPLPLDPDTELSPALAGTLAVGYRPRIQRPGAAWIADQVALVVSAGIGSSVVDLGAPSREELQGALGEALFGAGIEVFGFATGQVLVQASSWSQRDQAAPPLSLAVGVDAVKLARFTQNGLSRLFRANTLTPPEPASP